MADSKTKTGNIKDGPKTSCDTRIYRNTQKRKIHINNDVSEVYRNPLKEQPLAKVGIL